MTDTAFQILKLSEYKKLVDSKDVNQITAQNLMNDVYVPWLTELDRLDIRKTCSWPHSNMEGITKFRLVDHFWIWKALKCLTAEVPKIRLPPKRNLGQSKEMPGEYKIWLEKLHLEPPVEQNTPSAEDPQKAMEKAMKKAIRRFMEITKRLSPNNVQRNVLQRFTAENDVLTPARRMLAVTRSAIDMRFLFHARDTALFNGQDSGFFTPGSSFMQLWQNTIDAQLHHEENMDADSNNSLRHALGIAMGIRGYAPNNTSNASDDLVRRSINILIGASGSDAFFPGQLDEEGRGPEVFADEEYRDPFYHAGFEINYILFSSAEKIDSIFSARSTSATVESLAGEPSAVAIVSTSDRRSNQAKEPKITTENRAHLEVVPGTKKTIYSFDDQPTVVMKKSLPFNNAIPATNVNHISDEWLYQYPDFLRDQLHIEQHRVQQALTAANTCPKDFVTLCHELLVEPGGNHGHLDFEAGTKYEDIALHVMDTWKGKQHLDGTKKHEPKSAIRPINSVGELCEHLKEPRTAWTAKKRFIWLPYANLPAALACCVFSPEREKHEICRFFERHASYTKDVLDETSMVLNKWQTELYLSFYLLIKTGGSAEPGCGLPRRKNDTLEFFERPDLEIRRASMSFRFDGDFFDRFWTCHFIEHNPITENRRAWDHFSDMQDGMSEKQCSQRKVLEWYFLSRILTKMNDASTHFQDELWKILEIGKDSLAFASLPPKISMDHLEQFEKILQLVEEDLTANLGTLRGKWNRVETDRGGEKPRWTPNDEKKYRTAINKFRVKVERATGELQANRDAIRKLKEFLATTRKNRRVAMDRQRDARDRLRDADIRYFTYVTVIFQPLGFAASFYSMGGAPEPALIVSLVEFSATAFAVTLALILIYRVIASRNDDDGVLKKFSEASIKKYEDTDKALKKPDHRLSLQNVVHISRGLFERIAHYILAVVHWCWGRYNLFSLKSLCRALHTLLTARTSSLL
jgi:hypothetical protein